MWQTESQCWSGFEDVISILVIWVGIIQIGQIFYQPPIKHIAKDFFVTSLNPTKKQKKSTQWSNSFGNISENKELGNKSLQKHFCSLFKVLKCNI